MPKKERVAEKKEAPKKESHKKETTKVETPKKERQNKDNPIKYNYLLLIIIILLVIALGFILARSLNPNKSGAYDNPDAVTNVVDNGELYGDNGIIYKNFVYTLPEGWERNDSYTKALNVIFKTKTDDGITSYSGGIINIKKISSTGKDKDYIFKDTSFFQESLTNGSANLNVGEGKIMYRDDIPVVIFPCEYTNGDNSKVLLAFMPENDEYFYNIQFYSNRVVDEKDELYFNYEDLYTFIDFLNTRVKK